MEPSFLSATILLFLVLDPFGNMPLVATLLHDVAPARRLRVVWRECAIAYGVLLLFLFFGAPLLGLLQLSQTSLGIAGGVVLFVIALRMIFPPQGGLVFGEVSGAEPFMVPLAVPAIAGPSAMAVVMLLASRDPARLWVWVGALTLAMALSTLALSAGMQLMAVLGERVVSALERLMGLILCALAVEMLLRGVQSFVRTL